MYLYLYLYLYVDIFRVFAIVLSTRHVPDVRNVSCGAGGHLGCHQLLPGLHHQIVIFSDFHQLLLAFLLPTNHIPNIQIIIILGLILSPRLRDAQLSHRSHDLVHHEHGLRPHARCDFVFAFVLFLFGFSAFIYLCFRSMLGRDHVTKFHSIYFFSSFLETCPQMKQFLRRSQVRRKETEENALVI